MDIDRGRLSLLRAPSPGGVQIDDEDTQQLADEVAWVQEGQHGASQYREDEKHGEESFQRDEQQVFERMRLLSW